MRRRILVLVLVLGLLGPAQAADLQVKDDRGQTMQLSAPPQRIVSLNGGLTEILQELGLAERLVGRTQGDEIAPGIPAVGTHLQPNVEMIVALRPDLVVQGGVSKGMPALERLEREGVKVAMFAPDDFAGLFSSIKRLGILTGREAAASQLVDRLEKELAAVARRVTGRQPPRVFFEVRYHNLLAAGQGSIIEDIITRAGGVNVVPSPEKLVPFGLEALLQADPEVYVIQQGPMNRSPEDIYSRPNYQELSAVKNRRVLVVDQGLFSRPGPRSGQAVQQLARFLHPQAWGEDKP
ncbi:MAG: helical backbone metal receptor [Desulfobaccales bacterium]